MILGAEPDDGSQSVADAVTESTGSIVESIGDALPRLGAALIIIVVGYGASRVLRAVLARILARRQTPSFVRVMSKVGGWILLFLSVLAAMAAAFPSVKPVDLLAGLGFFSLAIGFAFQDILENSFSGVLLLFRQPFASGDQIRVGEWRGTVDAITIRETRITTFDGELVLIPNRDVYKSALLVQTHYDIHRVAFTVGIAYENDPDEAAGLIVSALEGVEGIAADPAPEALVRELGVSTVDIEARFWTSTRQLDTRRMLDRAIIAAKRALDENGIEMPADIVALQATPSFKAALSGDVEVTPGGSVRR
ncbi:MAG: mechanosensitive ion channel family protein [Acidimicrobiales bacterium]